MGAVSQTAPARKPQMCLDKRMRISVSQIAIYCAAGVEGELDLPLPNNLHTTVASAHNLLALKFCVLMPFKFGSGLPPPQQRAIEGTDFDIVEKEIRLLPLQSNSTHIGWSEIIFLCPNFISCFFFWFFF